MLYMAVLVAAVVIVLLTALTLLGRFDIGEKELSQTLSLQLEVFENDIRTLRKNINAMSTHFSADTTGLIEDALSDRGMTFDRLAGDADALRQIEELLLGTICSYVYQAECSGAFVVLDTAIRDYESGRRSCVYIQKSNPNRQTGELLLFRGSAEAAASAGIMLHRKWAQSADFQMIPEYERAISNHRLLEDKSCLITDMTVLSSTNESVMFALMPIVGSDGRSYGLCGLELSQTWFASRYAQPSHLSRMACVVAPGTANALNIPASLHSNAVNTYTILPAESTAIKALPSGLSLFEGKDISFVGLVTDFQLSGDGDQHKLVVMIPEQDYRQSRFYGHMELIGLGILLLSYVVICCIFFSRKFIHPVLQDISRIESKNHLDTPALSLEFDQAFDALNRREQTHADTIRDLTHSVSDSQARITLLQEQRERMQEQMQELQQQYDSVQTEIEELVEASREPDEAKQFRTNLSRLSTRERQLYEAYIAGKEIKEVAAQLAITESTVYYYNKKMYGKLNVHSIKELRRLAAILAAEEE